MQLNEGIDVVAIYRPISFKIWLNLVPAMVLEKYLIRETARVVRQFAALALLWTRGYTSTGV